MPIQLSDAFSALLELKKDLSDVPQATFVSWCDYINKFTYRFAIGIDPERFIQEQPLNALNGITTYALPADFRDMSHFGTGIYFLTTPDGLPTDRQLPRTGYGKTQVGFYLKGSNIILTPANWTQNYPFTIRYIPKQTTLASINDYFTLDGTSVGSDIIPEEYLDYVVRALDVRYAQWDEEIGSESYSDARFDRDLTELAKEYYREANIYFLEDNCPYY